MARDSALPVHALRVPRSLIVRSWLVVGVAFLGVFAAIANTGTAAAHPLGNFTVNRYARIEVFRDAFVVHYVVDYAEIPTVQLKPQIDANGDGDLSPAELSSYARSAADTYASNLTLTAAGQPLNLRPDASGAQAAPGQAGLEVLRVVVAYRAAIPASGATEVAFRDDNFASRPGWKEIVVRPSPGAVATVPPGFLVERSDALRQYPAESLNSAPSDTQVAFSFIAGTGDAAPAAVTTVTGTVRSSTSGFASLLNHDRSLGFILLSLLAAFGFGALHALGPGHGKSVVAAYLVGSRGTTRHAVALGATVTATHTSTVYLLGFITLTASSLIAPDRLFLYLGIASGVMIVLMGAGLLAGRLRSLGRPGAEGAHRHGFLGKAHSHLPAEVHEHESHAHDHPHPHPHDEPLAAGHEPAANARVGWKGLLTLGVAGGMIPCPSAIVVMLAAISLGQVLFGMLLIVAFSLGLAGVLTGIGIGLVWGKRFAGRQGLARHLQRPGAARLVQALPIVSALGVTLAGIAITYQAWNQPGL